MFLNFSGSISYIYSPIYDILSVPWYTVLTIGLENSETCLKLFRISIFNLNTLSIMGGDNPF